MNNVKYRICQLFGTKANSFENRDAQNDNTFAASNEKPLDAQNKRSNTLDNKPDWFQQIHGNTDSSIYNKKESN